LSDFELPDLSIQDVIWSVVPNLTLARQAPFPLTFNNTLLTVPKGAFKQNTKYTMTVTIRNKYYPQI